MADTPAMGPCPHQGPTGEVGGMDPPRPPMRQFPRKDGLIPLAVTIPQGEVPGNGLSWP